MLIASLLQLFGAEVSLFVLDGRDRLCRDRRRCSCWSNSVPLAHFVRIAQHLLSQATEAHSREPWYEMLIDEIEHLASI